MLDELWENSVTSTLMSLSYTFHHPNYYPNKESAIFRVNNDQPILAEFKRLFYETGLDLYKYRMNPNLLALSRISWQNKNELKDFSIQVFVTTEKSLSETLEEANKLNNADQFLQSQFNRQLRYYRFDFHPEILGPLFKEPIFHIHKTNNDEPRFHFAPSLSENLILNFFEFIYINHFYEDWLNWVENICESKNLKSEFDILVQLYNSKAADIILSDYLDPLNKIKKEIIIVKDKLFPWSFPVSYKQLFYY